MENARKIWEELGLPVLRPQSLWDGYSPGEWSDDLVKGADRAVKSEYFKTGEEIAKRRRRDVKIDTEIRDVPPLPGKQRYLALRAVSLLRTELAGLTRSKSTARQ